MKTTTEVREQQSKEKAREVARVIREEAARAGLTPPEYARLFSRLPSKPARNHTMKSTQLLLALLILCQSACTVAYYPSGQKAAAIGSNVASYQMQSGSFKLSIQNVDNSTIHTAAGNTVTKTGTAVATSGLFGFLSRLVQ